MLVTYALAALLSACAPEAHPQTMAAIISVESSGHPWTIHDNDTGRSYYMPTYADGVAVGETLLAQGHNVDLGLAQVNSIHLRGFGLTVADLMAPCANVQIGSRILHGAWTRAVREFGPTREALDRTMMAYNTGSLYRGEDYRDKVIIAAENLRFEPQPQQPAPVIRRAATVRRTTRLAAVARNGPTEVAIP